MIKRLNSNFGFLALFISFTLIPLLWVFFQPPFASVDEPAHAARAYTAVHGHLIYPANNTKGPGDVDNIRVPNWILPVAPPDSPYCFWTHREITADCAHTNWKATNTLVHPDQFAQYFPTFYAVAGFPSLFSHGELAYYLMRLFGLLECLFFVGVLFWTIKKYMNPNKVALAFIAITPMTILGAATLAPLALETISTISFVAMMYKIFVNNTPIAKEKSDRVFNTLFILTGFTALTSRPSGVFWSAGVILFFVASNPHHFLSIVRRNKRIAYLYSSLYLISALYLFLHRPKVFVQLLNHPIGVGNTLTFGVQELSEQFNNMVGIFGMDIYLPLICYYVFFGIFAYLVSGFFETKLSAPIKNSKPIMVGLIVLLSSVAMLFDYLYRHIFTHFWIGRYSTPLLGIIVTIACLVKVKNVGTWVVAGMALIMSFAAIVVGYLRYGLGLIPSDCCGVLARKSHVFVWHPFGMGILELLVAGSLSLGLFAYGATSVLLNQKMNEQ